MIKCINLRKPIENIKDKVDMVILCNRLKYDKINSKKIIFKVETGVYLLIFSLMLLNALNVNEYTTSYYNFDKTVFDDACANLFNRLNVDSLEDLFNKNNEVKDLVKNFIL